MPDSGWKEDAFPAKAYCMKVNTYPEMVAARKLRQCLVLLYALTWGRRQQPFWFTNGSNSML
jgi:hypothetical protein